MNSIKNIQPLSAETIYNLLKREFPNYINQKLDSDLAIEIAHVYDVINVTYPEVTGDMTTTITVNDDEINISSEENNSNYDSDLLETHLIDFINLKAG